MLVFLAVPISMAFVAPGWDLGVYRNAIRSLESGHDPYLDAITIQKLYYNQAIHPPGDPPFNYVYSPITLPILRLIGALPVWFSGCLYWSAYVIGVLVEIWVGMLALEDSERRYFVYLAPIAAFFPGLLANGTVLGGNVAYIIYPVLLLAAVRGWKRGTWLWFYSAVLAASCFKAPFLSLAVLPLLFARKQWIPAGITAAAGVGLFAITPVIWPALFRHYLEAIDLEFHYNHDFGCSPTGLFSQALDRHGIPYSLAGTIFYLAYALPLFVLLTQISRRFLSGHFSLKQAMPTLILGVILLNPRLIEYDLAPITILLAVIGWRFINSFTTPSRSALYLGLIIVLANFVASRNWEVWKLTEGPLLILYFAAGSYNLLRQSDDRYDHSPVDTDLELVA